MNEGSGRVLIEDLASHDGPAHALAFREGNFANNPPVTEIRPAPSTGVGPLRGWTRGAIAQRTVAIDQVAPPLSVESSSGRVP